MIRWTALGVSPRRGSARLGSARRLLPTVIDELDLYYKLLVSVRH